jgi:hypothetical protein
MNTQLVESLMQVILALPLEERNLLNERLANHQPKASSKLPDGQQKEQLLQALITTGRIIPPPHHQNIASILETELREITQTLHVFGKPFSETVIEDRGEW